MNRYLVAAAITSVLALFNATLGIVNIVRGAPLPLAGLSGLAFGMLAACTVISIRGYKKEKALGSDRQAEADSFDSDDITSNPFYSGGTISGRSLSGYTYSLSTGTSLNSLHGGGSAADVSAPEVERVEGDMPILAHRIARLRFDGTSKPFGSLNWDARFGIDEDAVCQNGRSSSNGGYISITFSTYGGSSSSSGHSDPAPSLGCTCGFYALPSDIEAWAEGHDYVTLMVELSGTVIEHEKGYRAGHQRVIECQIPACRYCGRESTWLDVRDGQMFDATCASHSDRSEAPGKTMLHRDDLTLPVPIVWLGRSGDAGASDLRGSGRA